MTIDLLPQILLILFGALVTCGLGLITWLIKRGLTKFDTHVSNQVSHSQLLSTHGHIIDSTSKTVDSHTQTLHNHSQRLHQHGERISKIEDSP